MFRILLTAYLFRASNRKNERVHTVSMTQSTSEPNACKQSNMFRALLTAYLFRM